MDKHHLTTADRHNEEQHPGHLEKINTIIDFFMDPCDAPLTVYAKTLWPALLEAIITFYAVDFVQIFTGYVRPIGPLKFRRGGSHRPSRPTRYDPHEGARKKKGGKRTWSKRWRQWLAWDPWDWLGQHLPGSQWLRARSVTPGVLTMWTFYGFIEAALFWYMVFEITEEFFYKWASGVGKTKYCQALKRPICTTAKAGDGNLGILSETPADIGVILKKRHDIYAAGNYIYLDCDATYISFKAQMHWTLGPPSSYGKTEKLRIRHDEGDSIDSEPFSGPGSSVSVSGAANVRGGWHLYYVGDYNDGYIEIEITCVGQQDVA